MAEMNFTTSPGETMERKLYILYLNTGTNQAPVWSPIGSRVEDSSAEYDYQENTTTDILGVTRSTMKKPIITQTFEPCDLDAGDAAQEKIWKLAIEEQNVAALANMDLLQVHAYRADASGNAFAERYPSSMVKPQSLGGSATITMPIDVTFGGERAVGTAAVADGVVTFTPTVAAANQEA